MNVQPRIEILSDKKLIGLKMRMSFADHKIADLWRQFMPRRHEIRNSLGTDLISMAIYSPGHFEVFDAELEFDRWAAVAVSENAKVPPGMETFDLTGGLYAVFPYKGLHSDNSIFQYIYGTWIPGSDYKLDNRPHFEILGQKYKDNDPDSEEDIWIPISEK